MPENPLKSMFQDFSPGISYGKKSKDIFVYGEEGIALERKIERVG